MSTLVIQSCYANPPAWVQRCMTSVKAWADTKGYDYRFLDDAAFFAGLPAWLTDKCASNIYPLTDYARLQAIQSSGHDVIIWLDADVLVFGDLALPEQTAFVSEVSVSGAGEIQHSISNQCMVFTAGDPLLDEYLAACQPVIESAEVVTPIIIAPHVVAATAQEIRAVQPLTEPLQRVIYPWLVQGGERPALVGQYRDAVGADIHAVDLCLHNRKWIEPRLLPEYDRKIDTIITALLTTAILN